MQLTEEQRKALITDCKQSIAAYEENYKTWGEHWRAFNESHIIRQKIAMAALTENWHERAEAAEAKLKDAQENSGFWGRAAAKETIRANKAEAKLAELVPAKKSTDIDYAYYPLSKARREGYNECVDDILRNIKETK